MKLPNITRMFPLALAAAAVAGSVTALADADSNQGPDTAIAKLYELQAAFHEAAGGAGVDAATKAQHLQEMLDIWTADGVLVVGSTVYAGRGEPNSSTCAPGSLTLCDFFQNHAGSFVLGRNWAALTSISRTLLWVLALLTGGAPRTASVRGTALILARVLVSACGGGDSSSSSQGQALSLRHVVSPVAECLAHTK